MAQPPQDAQEQVLGYARHQAKKSLTDLAALMERSGVDCARCIEGVSEAQARFSGAEKWTVKDVLAHLISVSRAVNSDLRNLAEEKPPKRLEAEPGMNPGTTASIDKLRSDLTELWRETRELVASLPEDGSVNATRPHPWFGPLNFREWIAFQRVHAMDHIQQIEKIKADPAYPGE